jgi:hypothetical protein
LTGGLEVPSSNLGAPIKETLPERGFRLIGVLSRGDGGAANGSAAAADGLVVVYAEAAVE